MANTQTPLDLIQYYSSLLIMQYVGKTKASSTIKASITPILMPQQSQQSITFSPSPTSGTFVLSYDGIASSTINWNDSAATIQTALQTISALSEVTVSGSIASELIIDFVGVTPIADLLIVSANNLLASGAGVVISINETDQTLPLALQNAFNLTTAVGVQLDTIGLYCGVKRTINTPTGSITLNDSDFRILIQFAIIQNTSGSSLSTIESNMNLFFPGQFIITDFKNMYMSYIISGELGSSNLFNVLVQEKLIPSPMGVGVTVFNPPVVNNYFGFSLYEKGGINNQVKPFNTYESFNTDWLWLDYRDAIT